MTAAITALILAGGQSSRMGQDKALLPWDGKPLLQRVCETATTCNVSVAILTPWRDRYAPHLPQAEQYQWLTEAHPGQGPLVALAQGLAHLDSDWVWLLACDLPLLDAQQLTPWLAQLPTVPPTTLALVPRQTKGWEPLCGFYRQQSHTALEQFLQAGGRSFQQWLTLLPAQAIELTPAATQMLWNCNSPADWPYNPNS